MERPAYTIEFVPLEYHVRVQWDSAGQPGCVTVTPLAGPASVSMHIEGDMTIGDAFEHALRGVNTLALTRRAIPVSPAEPEQETSSGDAAAT